MAVVNSSISEPSIVYTYYINTGAGNNAPGESYYTTAFQLRGINPYDNTHIDLYFDSVKQNDTVDTIRLTITAGKHKEVSDTLVKMFKLRTAAPPTEDEDPIITIYNGDTGYSIIPAHITGASILYGSCCSGGGGGGRDITVKDEGVTKTTALSSVDFVGSGVTATVGGSNDVTVTIPGGGTYTAGDGIEINTATNPDTIKLDVKPNSGVTIDSTELSMDLSASSITGTLAVGDGGTGQTTRQGALDALTAVSGASASQALIKDGSGNATWAAQTDTTYGAGNGLDLSGTTFSADLKANSGLEISGTEIALDLGASSINGTLKVGDGGTGATTFNTNSVLLGSGTTAITSVSMGTKGDLLIGDGTTYPSALSVGSDGKVLTAKSSATNGMSWETPTNSQKLKHTINLNMQYTDWVLRNNYLFPYTDFTNAKYGAVSTTSLSVSMTWLRSMAQAEFVNDSYTHITTTLNNIAGSLTATQIAALNSSNGVVQLHLFRANPTTNAHSYTLTSQNLGSLSWTSVANRITDHQFSNTLSSATSVGDLVFLGLKFSHSGGTPTGNFTGLIWVKATADLWKTT